jgi:hypothetical protein
MTLHTGKHSPSMAETWNATLAAGPYSAMTELVLSACV